MPDQVPKMIDREDMLELTRRMTPKRTCFSRVAGSYMDVDGFSDGTFNVHFLNLKPADKTLQLNLAKTIPFAKTNENLKAYHFKKEEECRGSFWQLLMGLNDCELKNDALLDVLYEIIGERYKASGDYAIYVYHGTYDVPVKATDKERLDESEEVYKFTIGLICPVHGDYEPGEPEWGFLFPAFIQRSSDMHQIAIYNRDAHRPNQEMMALVMNKK